jgi:hypothetical protein
MMQYSIAHHRFLDLAPAPDFPRLALEPVERPGVDGTAFWEVARRGQTCVCRSRVDRRDVQDALDTFDAYCRTGDDGPVSVTWADLDTQTYGVKYQVLDVRIADLRATAPGSGGLNPPSGAWLECDWTLKPVPTE